MVFVGSNDTGKTSVLRALASALAPTVKGERLGRWAPQPEMAAAVLAALPDEAGGGEVWIQGRTARAPAQIVTVGLDDRGEGSERFHAIPRGFGAALGRPVHEVVWLEVPSLESLTRSLRVLADDEVAPLAAAAFERLPAFARQHYIGVVLDAKTSPVGVALRDDRDDHPLSVLASGVRAWLLLALAEELRRGRRPRAVDRPVLFLVDEPELHLHPLGQQEVASWLLELLDGAGKAATMAVATHSAPVVEMALRRNDASVTICTRDPAAPTFLRSWSRASLEKTTVLAERAGLLASDVYLSADALLVVEGKHDLTLIPAIWRLLFGRLPAADGVRLAAGSGLDNMAPMLEEMAELWDRRKKRFVLADCPRFDASRHDLWLETATREHYETLIHDRFDIVACIDVDCYAAVDWRGGAASWAETESELLDALALPDGPAKQASRGRVRKRKEKAVAAMGRLVGYLDRLPTDRTCERIDASLREKLDVIRDGARP